MTVYTPSDDSLLLMGAMEKLIKKERPKTILDMGTGSGVLAHKAKELLPKAKVVGADIAKDAIKHAKKAGKGVQFILSDLFSAIEDKFDLIVFNAPYLPACIYDDDPTTTGGVLGFETTNEFLRQLPNHLAPSGTCLLLISSHTQPDCVERQLKQQKLKFEITARKKLFFEELLVYSVSL